MGASGDSAYNFISTAEGEHRCVWRRTSDFILFFLSILPSLYLFVDHNKRDKVDAGLGTSKGGIARRWLAGPHWTAKKCFCNGIEALYIGFLCNYHGFYLLGSL